MTPGLLIEIGGHHVPLGEAVWVVIDGDGMPYTFADAQPDLVTEDQVARWHWPTKRERERHLRAGWRIVLMRKTEAIEKWLPVYAGEKTLDEVSG